jgi:MFS family permease
MIGRLFFGFAVGIFSVIVPIFIIEISPLKLRGSFGTVSQVAITFGILVAYISGLNGRNFNAKDCNNKQCNIELRVNFAIPMIPAFIQFVLLLFLYKYESPKYYIITEDMRDAKYIFRKIHQLENVNQVDEDIGSSYENKEEIELLDLIDPNKDGRTLRSLSKSKYKRPFLVGLMLIIAQQLSGINIVIFYTNKFPVVDVNKTYIFSLIVGTLNFFATIMSIFLLRYLGRKILLLLGMLLM